MSDEIRVVIADDHPVLRQGLWRVIERDAGLRVVAETGDGDAALALISELKPQIALLDIDMPGLNGLALCCEVVRRRLPVEIVFLTIHGEEDLFHAAMDAGAKGYLLKESAATEIVKALRTVAAGRHYVTPSLSGFLVRRARQAQDLGEQRPSMSTLTPTERRVLGLISRHKSSKEIAADLFIHYRTVENHRTNICYKLGLHGHNALLKFALQHRSEL